MEKMNRKLSLTLIIFSVIISLPLIYLHVEYGMENIPADDLRMWNFQLNYMILAALGLIGILAGYQTEPESSPVVQSRKQESGTESLDQMESSDEQDAAQKPAEPEYIDLNEEEKKEAQDVAVPEEWAERDYE